ncbi:fumarylacetoacetate hydrolase family protein [Micromonospora sp. NPDC049900]|uniref:fumarylacetoacetate hydrolase family protein n=1 Tax=Micromonospora sp. NPDC049900 TaxID=3364275 RepID=UPI00378F0031
MNLVATGHGLGLLEGAEVALLDLPYPDVAAMLAIGEGWAPVRAARVRERWPFDGLGSALSCPLASARAFWGVGLNYHSKVAQTGRAVPESPVLFLRSPAAVSGPGATVTLPAASRQVDYEGELAVVVGRRMSGVPAADVWSYLAGVTAANDLTARDVMAVTGNPSLAKSFAGFGALGSSVRELTGPLPGASTSVSTWVNGVLRQHSRIDDQIFRVPELLARISHYSVLEPGDVVLTGTPAGTGQDRSDFLRDGDVVEVSVTGVLPLRTLFAAGDADQGSGPVVR